MLADYQRYYETHSRVLTRPYAGVPELLRELAGRGIPCCVLSNKPDADTQGVVRHYFPDVPFAVVRGQTDRYPLKPDPAAAIRVAEETGIPPENFAYLGDTAVDMECAGRAGMHAIGVLWGFREKEELLESGAEALLSAPADLLEIL